MNKILIRKAEINDMVSVLDLIKELAEFEREPKSVSINVNDLIFALGPCIGFNSFEVGNDFKKKFTMKDKFSKKYFVTAKNKNYFDLRGYAKFVLINLGFSSRRKMLHNNLKSIMDIKYITEFLEKNNLDLKVRAENLSINQWIELSNYLYLLKSK